MLWWMRYQETTSKYMQLHLIIWQYDKKDFALCFSGSLFKQACCKQVMF